MNRIIADLEVFFVLIVIAFKIASNLRECRPVLCALMRVQIFDEYECL
ncbi:MAG: hypothetical protein KDF59_01320 [Nitrosomonas sp.]|nr:hypothetical protein [Nitrosomonas sp.]